MWTLCGAQTLCSMQWWLFSLSQSDKFCSENKYIMNENVKSHSPSKMTKNKKNRITSCRIQKTPNLLKKLKKSKNLIHHQKIFHNKSFRWNSHSRKSDLVEFFSEPNTVLKRKHSYLWDWKFQKSRTLAIVFFIKNRMWKGQKDLSHTAPSNQKPASRVTAYLLHSLWQQGLNVFAKFKFSGQRGQNSHRWGMQKNFSSEEGFIETL